MKGKKKLWLKTKFYVVKCIDMLLLCESSECMYVQHKNKYQTKESLKVYVNPKFSTVIDEVDEVM